eukprot:COSAG01_NODE_1564_length_9896_cov_4.868837_3_plen_168_part_00
MLNHSASASEIVCGSTVGDLKPANLLLCRCDRPESPTKKACALQTEENRTTQRPTTETEQERLYDLKICDFGIARVSFGPQRGQDGDDDGDRCSEADASVPRLWTDYVATRWYRAPELICMNAAQCARLRRLLLQIHVCRLIDLVELCSVTWLKACVAADTESAATR